MMGFFIFRKYISPVRLLHLEWRGRRFESCLPDEAWVRSAEPISERMRKLAIVDKRGKTRTFSFRLTAGRKALNFEIVVRIHKRELWMQHIWLVCLTVNQEKWVQFPSFTLNAAMVELADTLDLESSEHSSYRFDACQRYIISLRLTWINLLATNQ